MRHRTWSLRFHLVVLVVAAILPISLFAAGAVVLTWYQQKQELDEASRETVDVTAVAIERELDVAASTLRALAASRWLTAGELRQFYEDCRAMLPTQRGWGTISLMSPTGEQIFNLRAPFGARLPSTADRPHIQHVLRTRTLAVSDLFVGRVTGEPTIDVAAPVERDGVLKYVLAVALDPGVFDRLLAGPHVRQAGIGAVFDREYRMIARSRDSQGFRGRPAIAPLLEAMRRSPAVGVIRTQVYDGPDTYSTWRRLPVGWTVGIGVPATPIEASLRRSLLLVGGSAAVLLVAGAVAAALLARRLTRGISLAAEAGRHMTDGERVADGGSTVRELAELIDTIGEARSVVVRAERERAALLSQEQEARQRAEAANLTKDEFLAILSHELRTPINAVYGWARMLSAGQLDDGARTRALDAIMRNSNAQVQLIDDLLDVSRIVTGKMRLDVRPVDVAAVVEAALDAVRPAAAAKSIRIQSVLDPRAGPITGDPNRLQQVVWNLTMNAVKFTPRGGRVQVHLQRVNSHVEIVVSDTGQGITPETLPFIFDRFRQGDSSSTRAHGGLGLGLALVRHLVEAHGGAVTAHSPGEGKGATFVVKLPVRLAAFEEGPEARVHPTAQVVLPAYPGPALDGLRVLVVDDDVDALDLATAILTAARAEVRTCPSAAAAREVLRDWRPDVLIADIEMPGEDGFSLIRSIRSLEAEHGGRVPAIALTAYGRVEDRVRTLLAGFSMHLPKPVDPAELTAVVASLAGRDTPRPG